MPLLRRLLLLAIVAVGFAVASTPALAQYARPPVVGTPDSVPFTLDSTNFRVHYQSDHAQNPTWAITQTQAGDIAARAERALAKYLADGYPRPKDDGGLGLGGLGVAGDGRFDIYVTNLSAFDSQAVSPFGFAKWDVNGPTSSGFIELAGNHPDNAFTQHAVARMVFHLVQFAMWLPTQRSDYWLLVASAEWAAFRADGYPTLSVLNPADISLDCRDPLTPADYVDANTNSNMCYLTPPTADYIGNGDARWPFFEYLSETYGPSFVKDIFNKGNTVAPTALAAVDDALQAKGSSLISAYNAWQRTAVTSSWAIPALQVTKPVPYLPAVFTGAADTTTLFPGGTPTATVPSVTVAANHLSTRFLKFQRGPAVGGSQSTTCWAATLTLTVSLPAGSSSQPVFYWDGPTPLVTPLSVNGNTATADVPWDTCTWISGEGFLSLPNASNDVGASLKVDAGDFVVSAKLKVNPAIQVTPIMPVTPPNPVFVTGPVISVSSSDIAPSITVFGPQLLKLSKTDTQVRLIIGASGQGQVSAKLGTLALGKVSLRAGNNDVRFTIPKGTLGTLAVVRGSAGAPNVLTLTPTSTDGTATGAAVTRTISVGPDKPSVTKTLAAKTLAKKAAAKKAAAKKTAAKQTKHATK